MAGNAARPSFRAIRSWSADERSKGFTSGMLSNGGGYGRVMTTPSYISIIAAAGFEPAASPPRPKSACRKQGALSVELCRTSLTLVRTGKKVSPSKVQSAAFQPAAVMPYCDIGQYAL